VSKTLKRFCAIVALITSSVFLGACTPDDKEDETSLPAAPPSPRAANSPNKTSTYYGAIDYRDCDFVKGWVFNGANPTEDINVALYIDDKLIETVPAKTLRPDVKAQNHGTGEYGYSFKIPANFKDEVPHTVSVKTVGSDYTLLIPKTIYATASCKP
jgi:hypothetical protein